MMNDEAEKTTGNGDFSYGRVGYEFFIISIECKSIGSIEEDVIFFYANWKRIR